MVQGAQAAALVLLLNCPEAHGSHLRSVVTPPVLLTNSPASHTCCGTHAVAGFMSASHWPGSHATAGALPPAQNWPGVQASHESPAKPAVQPTPPSLITLPSSLLPSRALPASPASRGSGGLASGRAPSTSSITGSKSMIAEHPESRMSQGNQARRDTLHSDRRGIGDDRCEVRK